MLVSHVVYISDNNKCIENNYYFPTTKIACKHLKKTIQHTHFAFFYCILLKRRCKVARYFVIFASSLFVYLYIN